MMASGAIIRTLLAATIGASSGQKPAMTDIHDIKPILEVGDPWPWLPYLLFGAILLIAGLGWWYWAWRRRQHEPIENDPPKAAPDQEALTALDDLAAETGLAPKHFFFRLSAILRRYIERRYHFPAAEMTTEELLPQMDRLGLEPSLATAFKGFCHEADPIKFAGEMANPERAQQQLVFCRDFVIQTRNTVEDREGRTPSHVR